MTDNEKWKYIKDMLDRIERRQDKYNEDNNKSHNCIRTQVISLREEMAGNRVRWRIMIGGCLTTITGLIGYLVSHFGRHQ